ncbi:MAG: glycosyltransferase family 2 protein [Lachnospiraceae bacterium]|nr:glycosyltransferase family 2 protein [Lachnospiraceae bacterium]
MEQNKPVATILMATYNGEKYVIDQIKSLLDQTYRPLEIIVIDDCSTDNTVDVIRRYCDSYDIGRLVTVKESGLNKGVVKNFLDAINSFRDRKYIFLCDQDDYWQPNKVELMMKKMLQLENEDNMPYVLCHNYNIADENNNVIEQKEIGSVEFKDLIYHPQIPGCCMMINGLLIERLRVASDKINMHDWYLSLVAGLLGKNVVLDEYLVNYRQHEDVVSGLKENKSSLEIINKYRRGAVVSNGNVLEAYYQLLAFATVYSEYKNFSSLVESNKKHNYLNIALWHKNNGITNFSKALKLATALKTQKKYEQKIKE